MMQYVSEFIVNRDVNNMASVTLVALSAVSGVPLFIRHRGTLKSVSQSI